MNDWFLRWAKWVDRVEQSLRSLRRDFSDPTCLCGHVKWELQNLARDIENSRQRGDTLEAEELAYYAQRLRRELAAARSAQAAYS